MLIVNIMSLIFSLPSNYSKPDIPAFGSCFQITRPVGVRISRAGPIVVGHNSLLLCELTATAASGPHYRRAEWPVSTSIGPRRRVTPPPRVVRGSPQAARPSRYLALNLARTRVRGRQSWSLAGKTNGVSGGRRTRGGIVVTRAHVKRKTPLSLVDNGGHRKRVMGFEPTTFTLATCGRRVLNREVR